MVFSNAGKNLKIPRFRTTNSLVHYISRPTLNAVLRFQNHPRISVVRNAVSGKTFSFPRV